MKRLKHLLPAPLACLALMAPCGIASAQAVYRCGNSYSQTPCSNGVLVPTDDPRSEAQRAAALQALGQNKQLAKELEASRHQEEDRVFAQEQAQRAAQARVLAAQARAETQKTREPKPHKKPAGLRTVKVQEAGVFTATVGSVPPKKTSSKAKSPTP